MGPAMDQQLIRDLFTNVLEASKELNIDDDFVHHVQNSLRQLRSGLHIGPDGRLMEWAQEFGDTEQDGYRHLSHLFALYPGWQLSPRITPELTTAARKSLDVRVTSGSSTVGWSNAWTIGLYARLGDGEKAYEHAR
jgi:alpha-L-fucosidase 2